MINADQTKEGLIAKLIEWSIKNKFLVIIFTVALIALGIIPDKVPKLLRNR